VGIDFAKPQQTCVVARSNKEKEALPMQLSGVLKAAAVAIPSVVALIPQASWSQDSERASPIYGVSIPVGYRQWELIAPSQEKRTPE
jgi:hypothetical protein